MTQTIAKCIDFTGSFENFEHFDGYGSPLLESLRLNLPSAAESASSEKAQPVVLVIDRGFNLGKRPTVVVSDHLNLTGASPLCGPNDPVGPRFPVINDIYVLPKSAATARGVVAGLKPGVVPADSEVAMLAKIGADFWSYNTVQTMLVAAHAGFKVIAFLVANPGAEAKASVEKILASENWMIMPSALLSKVK